MTPLIGAFFVLFIDLVEMYNDMQLLIKLSTFLAVISYVKMHTEEGLLQLLLMGGVFVFVFGNLWMLFGSLYVIYMLLAFGVSSIVIDYFFVGGMGGREPEVPEGGLSAPIGSGADVHRRAQQMHAMRSAVQRRPGMPG